MRLKSRPQGLPLFWEMFTRRERLKSGVVSRFEVVRSRRAEIFALPSGGEAALQKRLPDFFVAQCQIHGSLPAFAIANGQDLHQNLRMPDE